MKNSNDLKKSWLEAKVKLKEKFVKLTDNDLLFENETQDNVIERLALKLGLSRDDIHKIISE